MRGNVLNTVLFQVIFWIIAAYLFITVRLLGLAEYERIRVVSPIRYSLTIIQATVAAILIGIILGLVDVFLSRSQIRKRSFGFLVLVKGAVYIGTIIIILSLIHIFTGLLVDHNTPGQELKKLIEFYQDKFLLVMLIYALVISFLISFIKQVNQKFGPGNLGKMVMGKYFKPQQEERIFMFLDLRDSTTYAERIGHARYSEMIQDCFYDLATVVQKHRAEIYQYVGDEAVLTWKINNGLNDSNCIHLFFAFDQVLKSRSDHYSSRYGFVPEFKAGVNAGLVMVAEIGEIKKEIAYHGDVLNTAARIQSRCNYYQKNLLISHHLKEQLPSSGDITVTFLAKEKLKGKDEEVGIFSIENHTIRHSPV